MKQSVPVPLADSFRFARVSSEFSPAGAAADDERWITFSDLLRVVRVNWLAIVLAGAVAAAIGALIVSLMTPRYLGTALVMVDEQQNRILNDQTNPSVLSALPSDPSSVESQITMLQSHMLAGKVVDQLKLTNDPEFNGAKANSSAPLFGAFARLMNMFSRVWSKDTKQVASGLTPAQRVREGAIGKVLADLNVQAVGRSTIIQVDFLSDSPAKAARIANAIADSYVESMAQANSAASEEASNWLSDHVSQLSRQASAADVAVQQYKAQHGLVDTSTGAALTDQQLSDLTTQVIAAEGAEAEARSKQARVNELVKSGQSANVTEVVDSPLISQLREQEATLLQQKADMSSRYGDRNPKMVNIEAQLGILKQKINEEVNRVVGTVASSVAVAQARVGSLKSDMASVTSTTNGQNQARVELAELEANATSAHALYQTYLDRLKQTQQQASLRTQDVHVASPAAVPLAPVSPKRFLIIGGAFGGGLMLGFLFALLADRMCSGFRSIGELEAAVGLPVLATVPELGAGRGLQDMALEVVRKPHSEFSEAIRAMELVLSRRQTENAAGKVITVVSALPAEGKTTTAVSLARRFAADGYKRVVVVDGDFRRPKIAAAMGIRNPKCNLADYLAKRCLLDEAMSADTHSPVVALTMSRRAKCADIDGPGMAALIEHLRDIADVVVIDAPPVLAVSDAKLLAELSDAALFIVRWGRTPREAVMQAVKSLRDFGVPLAGATLVRANAKYHQYYNYGYAGLPTLAGYYES